MTQRITINGREYTSPHEMPPDARAIYDRLMVDRDGNGVPDVIDPSRGRGIPDADGVITHHEVVLKGTTYHRLEDVPSEYRKVVEKAFGGSVTQPTRRLEGPVLHQSERSMLPTLLIGASIGAGLMLLVLWLAMRN